MKFIEEQQEMNRLVKKTLQEVIKWQKNQENMLDEMRAWLKDHQVRLNLHWEEIRRPRRYK